MADGGLVTPSPSAIKSIESHLLVPLSTKREELRILVSGSTGQGKSALINGILGNKSAPEGTGVTSLVTEYPIFIQGTYIRLFDTPDLKLHDMRDTCKELNLILYCTKMNNLHLPDGDKYTIRKFTTEFGEVFWNFAVFVLTFANKEDCERKSDQDDDIEEPNVDDEKGWDELIKKRFQGRMKLREKELRKFLVNVARVREEITKRIPVVPVGDYMKTRKNPNPFWLPDRCNWLDSLWEACSQRIMQTKLFLKP